MIAIWKSSSKDCFERERERADRLMTELLRATAETLAAKEASARFECELAGLANTNEVKAQF